MADTTDADFADRPALSRARNPDRPNTELLVSGFPKEVIDMLDAVAHSRGQKSRGPLVIEILSAWAANEARKCILVQRVVGGNAALLELAGMDQE